MLVFDDAETVRSVQLYGTDPRYVGKAVEILCAEYGVAHVDLNFGCPVPKVTRKGGGGALPWKRGLLAEILEHAVAAAAPYDVPVTMKTRKGLDDDHLTYLDAGRIAQESGCAAIALHGRTVAQAYSGRADWEAIARAGRPRRHPGARQRRHLGGRRRAADGRADRCRRRRGRPRLPRSAVAVPRPRRRLRRTPYARCCRRLGEVRTHDAPPRRAAERAHGGGARLQGVPQARVVVPQGLRRRRHRCATRWRSSTRSPRSTRCSPSSTRTSRSRPPRSARRAAGRARRAPGWCCPRGGSTTPTAPACTVREDAYGGHGRITAR